MGEVKGKSYRKRALLIGWGGKAIPAAQAAPPGQADLDKRRLKGLK